MRLKSVYETRLSPAFISYWNWNLNIHRNQGAGGKEEIKDMDTVQERGREHWGAYRGGEKAELNSTDVLFFG